MIVIRIGWVIALILALPVIFFGVPALAAAWTRAWLWWGRKLLQLVALVKRSKG